jgi:DnaJ domain
MKRGPSRRNRSSNPSNHKNSPVTDRRIVAVNEGPLRKRAAKEFDKVMAKLEKARAELRLFEQEDRPSFGRWMAATFGALLTELRDNAHLIHEQEDLILEVESEMIWSNRRNPRRAYAAVMKRRERPDPDDDFAERDDFDPREEMGAENVKEERRTLFDDFVRSVLGLNPEQLGNADYEKMFAEFEANIFEERPPVRPSQTHDRQKPSASREEARIKEVYRTLVRRLHPDLRADGDATVSAKWHEVQEAYEARNLDRLETLLAVTEMESGASGRASLSQIRGALADFNRALRAIQRSLREAKGDPAWGFTQNPYSSSMEKHIRRELEESLSHQRAELADLKATIEDWSRPWRPPVKKPTKQSKSPVKPKAERPKRQFNGPRPVQTEFFAI